MAGRGRHTQRGNKEPPKISGAEILKKAEMRSKLRYQGFLRPPTAWIEDPKMEIMNTAFPGLRVLQTGRPPQPPPASGTTGIGVQTLLSSSSIQAGSGEGPGPFPQTHDVKMDRANTSMNDFDMMGNENLASGTVRSPAPKRKLDDHSDDERPSKTRNTSIPFDPNDPFWTLHNIDPGSVRRTVRSPAQKRRQEEETGGASSKKRNTSVPFDPNHSFWTLHNIDPGSVRRSPRTPFPDPISTYAHPMRDTASGPSTPTQRASTPRPIPSPPKRKATGELEGHQAKVPKPTPTTKRKANKISKNLVNPNANTSPTPKKQKVSVPTTVRERAAAFDRAVQAFPR